MKRLTTENPDGNFEIMLNFVYCKDGWAYIRYTGEEEDVPLTQWAKAQCIKHGCDEFTAETPQDIDNEICDCMMDFPDCPVALAYCFASQACHLRSRLKMYEDILFDADGKEKLSVDDLRKLTEPNVPLTLEELLKMDGEPVWIERCGSDSPEDKRWALVFAEGGFCRTSVGNIAYFALYRIGWLAYRRKPEDGKYA